MLDPEYLKDVTKGLEDYWYDLETKILADIAERLSLNKNELSSTAKYQMMVARELGVTNERVNQYLSEALNISSQEAARIIERSAYKSVESDNEVFEEAFKQGKLDSFNYSPENLKSLIERGISASTDEISNICKTTAMTAQNKLLSTLNIAYMQTSSGAFSADVAVDEAINNLAKEGLTWIDYKSGVHRRLDTTIRTAVRTAANQTAAKCQEKNMDDLGANLVEVTSHLGARPDHALWQGKIYYRKEPHGNYSNFYEATGYGSVSGLCGVNCRHSFYPYFSGISTKTFEHYKSKENLELYDKQQQQRNNERHIREWKRRRDVKKAAGLDVSKEKAKVAYWNKRNRELIASDARLKRNYGREKSYIKSDRIIPQIKISKLGEEKSLKEYSMEEMLKIAHDNNTVISKYLSIESKWSGKIRLDTSRSYKDWSCDIVLTKETSPMIILHEQLHSRSASYIGKSEYKPFRSIEEISTQFLTQEICFKENIEVIGSVYDEYVDLLRELNEMSKLYENDLKFAVKLYEQNLKLRNDWLEQSVYDKIKLSDDMDKFIRFSEIMNLLRMEVPPWKSKK